MVPCFFMLNVTPKTPIHTSIKPHYLNSNAPWHHIPPDRFSLKFSTKTCLLLSNEKEHSKLAIKYDHVGGYR